VRRTWTTLLLISVISISLFSIVAPVYVQGDSVAPAAKKTTTSTAPVTDPLSANATEGFVLKVDPSLHTVHHLKNGKTRSAPYAVQVRALSGFRGEVELAVQGAPPDSLALFNPQRGVPKPVFVSVLKIFVPSSTPAGVYDLTIIGASGSYVCTAATTLIVEGEPSPSTTPQKQNRLQVTVSTDEEIYQTGEPVTISGYVTLGASLSVGNANVSLTILDPAGETIHIASVTTSEVGFYSENFTLPSSTMEGTYTVFSAASLSGYPQTVATVTFVVGQSQVPSVRIVDVSVTLLNDTLSSEFRPGETVVIWTTVNSTGADLLNGNTWIEVMDPNNSPITVIVVVVTISAGAQERIGIHVILASDATIGTYTVKVLVSDGPILAGGRFLDTKETGFVVLSEEDQTSTTTQIIATSEVATTGNSTTVVQTTTTETTVSETSSSETTTTETSTVQTDTTTTQETITTAT